MLDSAIQNNALHGVEAGDIGGGYLVAIRHSTISGNDREGVFNVSRMILADSKVVGNRGGIHNRARVTERGVLTFVRTSVSDDYGPGSCSSR